MNADGIEAGLGARGPPASGREPFAKRKALACCTDKRNIVPMIGKEFGPRAETGFHHQAFVQSSSTSQIPDDGVIFIDGVRAAYPTPGAPAKLALRFCIMTT